jgi:isopenicillin N synthase-like dioxygenase
VNTTGEERYSIPFFFEPDLDAIVECIPTFCRDRPLYPPVRYGDYLVQRYRETHHDYKA